MEKPNKSVNVGVVAGVIGLIGLVIIIVIAGSLRQSKYTWAQSYERDILINSQEAFARSTGRAFESTVEELREIISEHQRLRDEAAAPGVSPNIIEDLKAARAVKFIAADKLMKKFRESVSSQEQYSHVLDQELNDNFDRLDPEDQKYFERQKQNMAALKRLQENAAALEKAWIGFKKTEKFDFKY